VSGSSPAGGGVAGSGVAGSPDEPCPPTVFFLTDYGLADEFVGVVHAVLRRLAPRVGVVDLTHGIAPFDVRAGAESLRRALPHLGPGVVLGVVDPGVGGARRGVAVRSRKGRWFVGPDNGLFSLVLDDKEGDGEEVEKEEGAMEAIALTKPSDAPPTFDGRDVFAPAAAALAVGVDPASLGHPFPVRTLVSLPAPVVERSIEGGRQHLRAEIVWCDQFGNLQLPVGGAEGPPLDATGRTSWTGDEASSDAPPSDMATSLPLAVHFGTAVFGGRRVETFSMLGAGELGVIVDSTGRLALVVREGSAAALTGARAGSVVELVW